MLLVALALSLATARTARAQTSDFFVEAACPAEAAAESDVTFTVTVTNAGPDDSLSVTLDAPLPSGLTFVSATQPGGPAFRCSTPATGSAGSVSCSITSMTAGSSAIFAIVAHVPAETPPGTTFTSVATVTCESDPTDENNAGVAVTSTDAPPPCDIGVLTEAPDAATGDTDVVFTITITNGGPAAAANFTLLDTLPEAMTFVSLSQSGSPPLSCTTPAAGSHGTVTCTSPAFPAGASAVVTLTGRVPPGASAADAFTNSATVTTTTADVSEENDVATTTVVVPSDELSFEP